jgi:beta-glucosidase
VSGDLLWGVATSAYQVEGVGDGRGRTEWDEFATLPDTIHGGDTAEVATDHYHRYTEDVALLRALGVTAYRFSISWTRIFPDGTGKPDRAGVAFYERLVDAILDAGITPFVTINHMELPNALAERGGWANRASIEAFVDYAQYVHGRFADRIRLWTTLNEVPLTTWNGYATRKFPPRNDRPDLGLVAIHHQLVAHGRAVRAMRDAHPQLDYGIVGSVAPALPLTDDPRDAAAAERVDAVLNRTGTDPIFLGHYPKSALEYHRKVGGREFIVDGDVDDLTVPLDFFGVNYYSPLYIAHDPADAGGGNVPAGLHAKPGTPAHLPRTSFGWLVQPSALVAALRRFRDDYALPVYITENGASFADEPGPGGAVDDVERIDFLARHIQAMDAACAEGIDVRGYFVWSFTDNFEWASGYSQRFGLVHVDYETLVRTPKASFDWYRDLIARRGG